MQQIHTLADAQDALRPFYNNARTPYTLDTMRALMQYLGNPQDKLRVVHIAGTSGKTSTAYYCAALLKAAGKTVGLSVSPHVDTVNERIQINGAPLVEADFCEELQEFLQIVEKSGIQPSYFELLVAMAYWEFARREVEYAVIEVGLGGLLDGTNVVTTTDKVCVITDIGYDHTEILGETLSEIATQKAGIIHDGNVVFMYRQDSEVMDSVKQAVSAHNATLLCFESDIAVQQATLPIFQGRNLGLAQQVVSYVLQRDYNQNVPESAISAAAAQQVPARMERFTINGKTVIVDGSHNQQKIATLLASVADQYPGQEMAVLCAFVQGNSERWQGGLQALAPRAHHLIFTSFHSELDIPKSSVATDEIVKFCENMSTPYEVITDPAAAYRALLAQPEEVLLITGSFYLLNHIRPLMREQQ